MPFAPPSKLRPKPPAPPPPASRYRLYLDESGDHAYRNLHVQTGRYLGLLGVWFEWGKAYLDFNAHMAEFKKSVFGNDPDNRIVLHRRDIVQRNGPFGILREPANLRRFDDGLLKLIDNAKCMFSCVVIDKKSIQERYSFPCHPYHFSLDLLLERFCGFLGKRGAVADVMAESRGAVEDEELNDEFANVLEHGTAYHPKTFFGCLTSNKIKFKKKYEGIAGLELADLLATDMTREVLRKFEQPQSAPNTFCKKLVAVVDKKLHRGYYGNVNGYGMVFKK